MNPMAIVAMANVAFANDAASTPETTLRGGQALAFYDAQPPFDPAVDAITDTYSVQYADGLTFLDASSGVTIARSGESSDGIS